jgi:Spy/CpxP family protein refolding chaperone
MKNLTTLLAISLFLLTSVAQAQGQGNQKDVFKGKLFPPNIILEHQDELNLSKEQFTAIRAAVVEVQSNVAEHEWDLREAYQRVLSELDESPIDEDAVLDNVDAALRAENQVKKLQVAMLIRLRNLLTDEQVAYLQSVDGR